MNASTKLSMNGKSPLISTAPPFVLRLSKDERRVFSRIDKRDRGCLNQCYGHGASNKDKRGDAWQRNLAWTNYVAWRYAPD